MPPKPKKEKKKKRATEVLTDVDTTVLTREKLEEFCLNVSEAIAKERQDSELLRLDRDRLVDMVALSREQLTRAKDTLANKTHELQEAEVRHALTMWELKQQLNHLTIENNTATVNSGLEAAQVMKRAQLDHEQRISELLDNVQELNTTITIYEDRFRETRVKEEVDHATSQSRIREEDKEGHILKEIQREKIFTGKLKELGTGFDEEYRNLEKRKNAEIGLFLRTNVKFMSDLKHYYNQVVHHNLSVIHVLRTDYEKAKVRSAAVEKLWERLGEENTYLATTLSQAQEEEARLRGKLACSQEDQSRLKLLKVEVKNNQERLEHERIHLVALDMRVDLQESLMKKEVHVRDRRMFYERLTAEEIIVILEFILNHLYHRDKEADANLCKIKTICLESGKENKSLESIPDVEDSDSLLDDINYQIACVAEKRQMVLAAYQAVLTKYRIPLDNTGLTVLGADDILESVTSLRVMI